MSSTTAPAHASVRGGELSTRIASQAAGDDSRKRKRIKLMEPLIVKIPPSVPSDPAVHSKKGVREAQNGPEMSEFLSESTANKPIAMMSTAVADNALSTIGYDNLKTQYINWSESWMDIFSEEVSMKTLENNATSPNLELFSNWDAWGF